MEKPDRSVPVLTEVVIVLGAALLAAALSGAQFVIFPCNYFPRTSFWAGVAAVMFTALAVRLLALKSTWILFYSHWCP